MTIVQPFRSRLLLPKQLPFADPAARRFFYCYRSGGQLVDPLGEGNTALLAALGLTPILFHDVRLLPGPGAIGSFPDVSGNAASFGGALTQGTGIDQPVFDGTTLNFDGSNDTLASALLASIDISTQLTFAMIADWSSIAAFTYAASLGASGQWGMLSSSTPRVRVNLTSVSTVNADTAVPPAAGRFLLMATINVAAAAKVTAEIPNQAQVTSSAATPVTSASGRLWLGSNGGAASWGALKYRTSLLWPGGYTAAQRNTMVAWGQAFHSEATE